MKLYLKSEQIQAARYMQLNKDQLRLKYLEKGQGESGVDRQAQVSDSRKRDFSLQNLIHADNLNLEACVKDNAQLERHLASDSLQNEFSYMTFRQVAAKRNGLLK